MSTNGIDMQIVGNLGGDIDLRYGGTSGKPWASFSVAVTEVTGPRGDDSKKNSSWIRCKAFGDLAEHAAQSLKRGTRVMVFGKLREENWTTPEGDKRSSLVLTVSDIGPSLMWAEATLRSTSSGGGDRGGSSRESYSGGSQSSSNSSTFGPSTTEGTDPWASAASTTGDKNPFDD